MVVAKIGAAKIWVDKIYIRESLDNLLVNFSVRRDDYGAVIEEI